MNLAVQPKPKRAFTGRLVGLPPDGPFTTSAPVTPEPAQIPTEYDPQTYEAEIKKVLGHSSLYWMKQSDREDLKQAIHIELWDAIKRYTDKMTPALAYTIAWNHVTKCIDKRAKESEFVSIDDKPERKDDESEISKAEELIFKRDVEGVRGWEFDKNNPLKMSNPGSWEQALRERDGFSGLKDLICTWTGIKRFVADAVLVNPNMTIDDLPGIPRSTVHRWREIILKEFKNHLRDKIKTVDPREKRRKLARKFLGFIFGRGLTMDDLKALPVVEQQTIKDSFLAENKLFTN